MMKNFRQNVCMILTMIMVFTFAGCRGVGAGGNETTAATTESVIETTVPEIATGAAEETTEATLETTVATVETTVPMVETTTPSMEVTEPGVETTAATEVTEPTETTKPTEPKETEPTKPKPTEPKETEPTKPKPTEPKPTEPKPTEPKPTTPAHQHSYTSEVTKAASCTSEGVKTFTCSCGNSYNEAIKKLEHTYSAKTTAATCEKDGYTVHTCSVCGDSYEDSKVPAPGHNYSMVDSKAATCSEAGFKKYECSRCGKSYSDKLTTAHDWEHAHTDEVGHNEVLLVCRCGWSCSETEASAVGYTKAKYWTYYHVKKLEAAEQLNHSYHTEKKWVIDTPASDVWTCKTCGKTTTKKP